MSDDTSIHTPAAVNNGLSGTWFWRRLGFAAALMVLGLTNSVHVLAGPEIQTWQTANGAKVLFVAAPEIPMLDVRVVFDAGSARDGERPGLMKLVNSLLTQGAGEWDADAIAERMDSIGAQLNTGSLRDMAWVSVRSLSAETYRDQALETLAVILSEPNFAAEDLERLRENMLVSLRQSEQSPGSVAKKAFYKKVYGGHPYAIDMDGTKASLSTLTQTDVRSAYKRFYVGKNAVIAIIGDLTRVEAEAIAARVAGGLETGQAAPPLPGVDSISAATIKRIDFPSSQSHVFVGQPGMRRRDADYFPLYVGNHILGGSGLVSILSEEVREKRGLSYSVYSYFLPMHKPGPFLMGLQTKNSQAEAALQVLLDTLNDFRDNGPTGEALQAAKQNITGGFPLRIASNSKIVEYLAVIGFYDLPLDYLDTFVAKVEAVTAEEIKAAFQRRIKPDRLVTVVLGRSVGEVAAAP